MLCSEEYGKDLASVQNLLKKHQLLEADVAAHEVSQVSNRLSDKTWRLYSTQLSMKLQMFLKT